MMKTKLTATTAALLLACNAGLSAAELPRTSIAAGPFFLTTIP